MEQSDLSGGLCRVHGEDMGKTQHIELTRCLSAGLLKAFKAHVASKEATFVEVDVPPLIEDEPDSGLFADTDAVLGRGDGFFHFDEVECASRRLDMRTELDRDPGPIEMEEAPPDEIDADAVFDFTPGTAPERVASSG